MKILADKPIKKGASNGAFQKRPVGRPRVSEERRREVQRAASLRYWRRVRRERREAGLTAAGTTPVYERHLILFAGFNVHGKRRKSARQKIYRARLAARGLTTLGQPKRGLLPLTPLDRAWRALRATISVPTTDYYDHTRKGGENFL